MIRSVMVMNTQGKPRLSKFYDYQPVDKQQELIRSGFGVLCSRAENASNFMEADSISGPFLWRRRTGASKTDVSSTWCSTTVSQTGAVAIRPEKLLVSTWLAESCP